MEHLEDKVQDFQSIGSTTDPQITSIKKEKSSGLLQVVSDNTVSTSDECKGIKSNGRVALLQNCNTKADKDMMNDDEYISDLLQHRMKLEQANMGVVKQYPAKFKHNGFVLAKAVLNLRDLYDAQCERNQNITSPTSPTSQIIKKKFVNAQMVKVKVENADKSKDVVNTAPILKDQPMKIKVESPQTDDASISPLSEEIASAIIDTNSLIDQEGTSETPDTPIKKYSYEQHNSELLLSNAKQTTLFKCRYKNCEFTSIREQNVNFHISRVHEAKEKDFPFFCKICRIGFYMKGLLADHTLQKHESPSTSSSEIKIKRRKRALYTQPEYDSPLERLNDFKIKKTKRKISNMKKIQRKYQKRVNKVITCSTFEYSKRTYKCKATNCQWSTGSGTLMLKHILKHRSDTKPIKCQHCSIEFRCNNWLRKHMIKYHKRYSRN